MIRGGRIVALCERNSLYFRFLSTCKIVEVGPRDGLQNEPNFVPTQAKLSLIDKLTGAGCKAIEVGAFVSPKWVPQMADSAEILDSLPVKEGVRYSCLVPNIEGMIRALEAKKSNNNNLPNEVAIFASASETFSQKNINCSIEESIERFIPVIDLCKEEEIPVRGYVSCVVGCPYEGKVDVDIVAKVSEKLVEMGCYEISLGDTIGIGTPNAIRDLLTAVKVSIPIKMLAVHFHDTYGQALANILEAIQHHDIEIIDSSISGLGGCPYARGASGNVATEDVVYMLEGMGIQTGIDLDKAVDAGNFISGVLNKQHSGSKVANAILARRNT